VKDLPLLNKLSKVHDDAGGAAGIEKILTAFYTKMSSDIMLGFFFEGKDLGHIIRQQKSFLLRAMGKEKTYTGKSPAKAHLKIPPILKGHFDRRLVLLRETLEQFGVPQESRDAWIEFESQFRNAIVKEEGPITK
jgi:hemoglobin